jgi:hypothetical protein
MLKRLCATVFLVAAIACGGSKGTATSPSPTATATTTFALSGRVTGGSIYTSDSISTAISGATVSIVDGPNAGKATTTDASGNYTFAGLQQSGFTVNVSAINYVSQSRGVTLTSSQRLNFTLTRPPPTIVLTGRVIDSITSAPIAGGIVSINGRYRATTNSAGNYSVTGLLDAGDEAANITYVSANGYASDYRHIRGTTQNVHLYRIERITAGDSKSVTVAPDDTLCVNNVQDTPGLGQDYVCRSVRVVAPTDGILTVEALSTQGGAHPPLEVEIGGTPVDWSGPMRNPTSFQLTAGTEVVVNVEMVSSSTTSQTLTLTTSMAQR